MKRFLYVLILPLMVIIGLLVAKPEIEQNYSEKSIPKPLSIVESKAALKKWEASPDGQRFKKWEASPAGKKVQTSAAKIGKSVREFTNLNGVVTSLSLPHGSRLGFGVMVLIDGEDYILAFGPEKSATKFFNTNNEFEPLHSLKVNDNITIRSQSVTKAPKYSYPIIAGDYVERGGKIIYKRAPRKGGC